MSLQILQRWKTDVIANCIIDDQRLIVSVFGSIGNTVFDGIRNGIDRCAVSQSYTSLAEIGSSEECLSNLMHTAFGKSSDTKDLTFVKIKVQVLDLSFYCHVLSGKNNFIRYLFAVVCTIVAITDLTAYH